MIKIIDRGMHWKMKNEDEQQINTEYLVKVNKHTICNAYDLSKLG